MGAGARRRAADRRGAGGAGPPQGPAGPPPWPLGRAGPGPPRPRPCLPRAARRRRHARRGRAGRRPRSGGRARPRSPGGRHRRHRLARRPPLRPGRTTPRADAHTHRLPQREAQRFAPGLAVHVHHGAERLGGEELAHTAGEADLVLTTYGLAARDRAALAAVEWRRVVLDEAQNIKNSAAKQTHAVRALQAPQRVALTGTPVENRLSELWSIMEFANPGLLGSAKAFRSRFAVPIEREGDERAAEGLRRATQPFILRRLKTDRSIIADLPAKLEMKVL